MASRHICPSCHSPKRSFTRYIDTETKQYIHDTVGRCERENNCGYHYKPKDYFQAHGQPLGQQNHHRSRPYIEQKRETSYIPLDMVKESLSKYAANNFVQYLISVFGESKAMEAVRRYFVGTSDHWNGGTVFWQIDNDNKVRAGKIMLYNRETGKRVKEPYNHIQWTHKAKDLKDFVLTQCLFGSHLLRNTDKAKQIAIVESEKTAIIASIYEPDFVWMATGSLSNLSKEKCNVLKGRKVVLFPDIKGYEKWEQKAKELRHILTSVQVSNLLESKATDKERTDGLDIADYLLQYKPEDIKREPKEQHTHQVPNQYGTKQDEVFNHYRKEKPNGTKDGDWTDIIQDLDNYFSTAVLPSEPVKLYPWTTINNVKNFIDGHLETVKSRNGNSNFTPHLNRLRDLQTFLKQR